MARNMLKDWLDKKIGEVDLIDYFGPIYDSKPDQFEFTRGDVKMICQISEYLQTTVRKNGYRYFKGKDSQCPENMKRCETNKNDDNLAEIQDKLFEGVSNLLLPYGQDVVSLFKKGMAIVKNENGAISGRVRCVLCDRDSECETNESQKRRRRQAYYSQFWNGHSWCLSNFSNHHLRHAHPIQINANQQTEMSQVSAQMQSDHDFKSISDPENQIGKDILRFEKIQRNKHVHLLSIIYIQMKILH